MIRLYCSQKLSLNKTIVLGKNDTHYLKNVMRCKESDQINLFNENDKEFFSKILKIQKDEITLKIFEPSKNTEILNDIFLIFSYSRISFYLMGIVGHAFASEKRYHKDEARNEKQNRTK